MLPLLKKFLKPLNAQHGFTLVELIVVLVLIGILAIVAVPRFIDLSSQARQQAINSIAATLTTASAQNYAKRTANPSLGSAISNCTNMSSLISSGLPTGYSIASLAIPAGSSVNCTLNGPNSATTTFVGIGIS